MSAVEPLLTGGETMASNNRWRAVLMVRIICLTALLLTEGRAVSEVLTWTNAAGGSFETPTNWSPVQAPASVDSLRMSLPESYSVSVNSSGIFSDLRVADGDVTLDLGGQSLILGSSTSIPELSSLSLGAISTATGQLRVQNGTLRTGEVQVGGRNPETLSESGAGLLEVGANGVVETLQHDFHVGRLANGHLRIVEGGKLRANEVFLGPSTGYTGDATVSDAGSSLDLNWLLIGGQGELTVEQGGAFSVTSQIQVGTTEGTAAVVIRDPGTTATLGRAIVGMAGAGSLTIAAGATVNSEFIGLGKWSSEAMAGPGLLVVDGPATNVTSSSIAAGGSGTQITLTNGGTVRTFEMGVVESATLDATQGYLHVGELPVTSAPGVVTVSAGRYLFLNEGTVTAHRIELAPGSQCEGSGTVASDLVNQGAIEPGPSIVIGKTLRVQGDYQQTAGGRLSASFDSTLGDLVERLDVTGNAQLDGTLNVSIDPSLVPAAGQEIPVLSAATVAGQFADLQVNANYAAWQVNYQPQHVSIEAQPLPGQTWFVLDADESFLTLSGDLAGLPLLEQSPGSMRAYYQGMMIAELRPGGGIALTGATTAAAIDQPGPFEPFGKPADYAVVPAEIEFPAAVRQVTVGLSQPLVTTQQGNFPAGNVEARVGSGVIDVGNVFWGGYSQFNMAGQTSSNLATGSATITRVDDQYRLEVPLVLNDFSVDPFISDVSLSLQGSFVGYAPAAPEVLAVASVDTQSVYLVDELGFSRTIAGPANGLLSPVGISSGPDGELLVSDFLRQRIWEIALDGQITALAGPAQGVATPVGVDHDGLGRLWVANYLTSTLARLSGNQQGGLALTQGLSQPFDVAIGPDGSVWIANLGAREILRLDTLGQLSVLADASDGLLAPVAVDIGPDGKVYVADALTSRIWSFSLTGARTLFADASDGLVSPTDLAWDDAGQLYVADYLGDQILRFSGDGTGSLFAVIPRPFALDLLATGVGSGAMAVPEASTCMLVAQAAGCLALASWLRRTRRQA